MGWISGKTIQVKVKSIFKILDEEIEVKNQDKEKIDEVLQRYINL